MKRVVVVGGGASGLAAAISAARAGARVAVFERGGEVGKPVLKTGNGRCNLTNTRMDPSCFNDPAFVSGILSQYGTARVRSWFEDMGLLTREEREGRVYPLSNMAATVVDVLRLECRRAGVLLCPNMDASQILLSGNSPSVLLSDNTVQACDAVVAATGGGSCLLASCGHSIVALRPVLCSLACGTRAIEGLANLRARCEVKAFHPGQPAPFASLRGEVLFRDYGLSGIVIFDMSRLVIAGDEISLDFLPGVSFAVLEASLARRAARAQAGDSLGDVLCGMLPSKLGAAVLRMAGYAPDILLGACGVQPAPWHAIACAIKDFRMEVDGVGDAEHAQVTRGGACTDEFDPLTMASRICPGIFACGETLDVDGACGGYNLHWAWASGIAAGTSAAIL